MSDDVDAAMRAEIEAQRDKESADRAADAAKRKSNSPAPAEAPITDDDIDRAFHLNQYGDADLAVRLLGGRFVHDNTANLTYLFDRTHFKIDYNREWVQAMRAVADLYGRRAQAVYKLAEGLDDKEAAPILKTAKDFNERANKLRSGTRVNGVWGFATSGDGSLGISGQEWNADPLVLPASNVVIALDSGKSYPGDPRALFNKASPYEYHGLNVDAPLWDSVIDKAFCGKARLREYFEAVCGVAATGHQSKDFFLAVGEGNSAKSVVFDTIRNALGGFAVTIKVEQLLEEKFVRSSAGADPDILQLRGSRLAMTSEAQENHRFSLSKVKRFTGGDVLTGRNLNSSLYINFSQNHTLIMHTNKRPKSDALDQAFFNRVKILPFEARFIFPHEGPEIPEENVWHAIDRTKMDQALAAEGPGILAWLVRCAVKYLRDGMPPPPDEVLHENNKYRREMDDVLPFLEQCCDLGPDYKEQMKIIHGAFKRWCVEEMNISKDKVRSYKWLAAQLENRKKDGIVKYESNKVYYRGMRIREDWYPKDSLF